MVKTCRHEEEGTITTAEPISSSLDHFEKDNNSSSDPLANFEKIDVHGTSNMMPLPSLL